MRRRHCPRFIMGQLFLSRNEQFALGWRRVFGRFSFGGRGNQRLQRLGRTSTPSLSSIQRSSSRTSCFSRGERCHVGRPVQPQQGPCRGNRRGPRALISRDLFPSLFWKDYIIYFKKKTILSRCNREEQSSKNKLLPNLSLLSSLPLAHHRSTRAKGGRSYRP